MRRTAWTLIFLLAAAGCADVQAQGRRVRVRPAGQESSVRWNQRLPGRKLRPRPVGVRGGAAPPFVPRRSPARSSTGRPRRISLPAIRAATRPGECRTSRFWSSVTPRIPRADDAAVLIDLARRASAADKTNQELKNEIKKLKEAHIKLEELERKKRN